MVSREDYQKIDEDVLQLLIDYSLFELPIDVFRLAEDKLHAKLIPFTSLEENKLKYLFSKTETKLGFTIIELDENGNKNYKIYYNDLCSFEVQRYTISHEIKHIVYGDDDSDVDSEILAEHFARVLLCPPCLLAALDCHDVNYVSDLCCISIKSAGNAVAAIKNRLFYYPNKIYDYEISFLSHLKNKESILRLDIINRYLSNDK